MKKLITLCIALCTVATVFAQSKTVESFRAKYSEDRDAKSVSVSGSLFELVSKIAAYDEDEEAQAMSRIASNIEQFRLLSIPLVKSGFSHEDVDKMRKDLKGEKYEELMTVKEGLNRVYFMTQGNDDQIKNMVVLIKEDDEFVVMDIDGTLEMKDISYLAKHHKEWK